MRALIALACALACGACMQETVRFQAKPQQQAIVRDGQPALISQKMSSLVMIRPAARQFPSGARPVFVVGIRNLTKEPLEFRVHNIAATQAAGAEAVAMKVFSYEELVAEEKTRQVVAALLVGAAAGANTALASQAGYRTRTDGEFADRQLQLPDDILQPVERHRGAEPRDASEPAHDRCGHQGRKRQSRRA